MSLEWFWYWLSVVMAWTLIENHFDALWGAVLAVSAWFFLNLIWKPWTEHTNHFDQKVKLYKLFKDFSEIPYDRDNPKEAKVALLALSIRAEDLNHTDAFDFGKQLLRDVMQQLPINALRESALIRSNAHYSTRYKNVGTLGIFLRAPKWIRYVVLIGIGLLLATVFYYLALRTPCTLPEIH
ncbi:MAG: hypothetical protein ABIO95_00725 [Bdellovibrionota bacterium]